MADGATWTVADVPDLSGTRAVVTGANSGLGFETARALARNGARVVMACRSTDRGADAAAEIREESPAGSLAVRELDLADLESVRAFAGGVADEEGDLDLLVNNAGVMAIPRRETADGFERQFGVNHLGHFALAGRLLDCLAGSGDEARVVTVSSGMHRRGTVDFDDLQGEQSYDEWDAYAQSKLANLLFAFELQRRLDAAGLAVRSVGAHPGYADTALQFRGPEMSGSTVLRWMRKVANALLAQPAERGALPILYAATAPDVVGGGYYGPGGFMEMRGSPERVEASDRARDGATAERLWRVSERLTGVEYDLARPASPATTD